MCQYIALRCGFVGLVALAACGPPPVSPRGNAIGPTPDARAAPPLDGGPGYVVRSAPVGGDASSADTLSVVDSATDATTFAPDLASERSDGPDLPSARPPDAGELVIQEILLNPTGQDLGREWIEIANVASDELDLSSLHLADRSIEVAVAGGIIAPSAVMVLGQSADPSKNGGAPVALAYGTRLMLNNDGEGVSLCVGPCATGLVVDSVSWGTTGDRYDGHALVVDATKGFCPASQPFGTAGDFGTPGQPNPPCSAPNDDAGSAPPLTRF